MIEFIESTHQYLLDDLIIIPSVSEIVRFALGNEFKGIPSNVLKRAAQYGTTIHDLIQDYEELDLQADNSEMQYILDEYIDIKESNNIDVLSMEKIIYTQDYAGRYDMIANVNNKKSLIDIKTNSIYPEKHLEIQLGLYLNALDEELDTYCLWLNKKTLEWQFKKVNAISHAEAKSLVESFKKGNKDEINY